MSTAQMTWLGFAVLLSVSMLQTGRLAYLTLRPPKLNRPMAAIAGLVLIGVAFGFAHIAAVSIGEGVIDFRSRLFGHVFASRDHAPIGFWLIVAAAYGGGLLLASYGIASIGLCWKGRARAALM